MRGQGAPVGERLATSTGAKIAGELRDALDKSLRSMGRQKSMRSVLLLLRHSHSIINESANYLIQLVCFRLQKSNTVIFTIAKPCSCLPIDQMVNRWRCNLALDESGAVGSDDADIGRLRLSEFCDCTIDDRVCRRSLIVAAFRRKDARLLAYVGERRSLRL